MSWTWSVPTTVLAGDDAITGAAHAAASLGGRALVVTDAQVQAGTLLVERWRGALAAAGVASLVHVVGAASLEGVEETTAAIARGGAQLVVAVGGGTVMDTAKAAALAARCPDAYASPWAGECGLVIPEVGGLRRPLPSVLCPTTVGTGSEVSPVACLSNDGRKKLVTHPLLRPSLAVLDPEATAATPRHVVVEGALEVLLRSLGPALGTPAAAGSARSHRALADRATFAAARQVLRDGEQVVRARGSAGATERAARHRLALASAETHLGWGGLGREPWGHKLWYLAHEVGVAVGVSKITATAALLPAFLRVVGEGGWLEAGSPARLGQLLRLTDGGAHGGAVSVEAASRLLAHWGLPTSLAQLGVRAGAVGELARRTFAAWGPPLPALAGIDVDGVAALYDSALTGCRILAPRAQLLSETTSGGGEHA